LNNILLNPSPTKPHENPNRLTLKKRVAALLHGSAHFSARFVRVRFVQTQKTIFPETRARLVARGGSGEMAQFGDGGGGGEDEGGGDARRGWDPLRSDSAPPTMEGSAAEGMFGGGGGPGGRSFFSGMDGLGARLDEVSRLRGAVAQVKGVLGLELIEVFGFFAL
jgi:hypothetical protein